MAFTADRLAEGLDAVFFSKQYTGHYVYGCQFLFKSYRGKDEVDGRELEREKVGGAALPDFLFLFFLFSLFPVIGHGVTIILNVSNNNTAKSFVPIVNVPT